VAVRALSLRVHRGCLAASWSAPVTALLATNYVLPSNLHLPCFRFLLRTWSRAGGHAAMRRSLGPSAEASTAGTLLRSIHRWSRLTRWRRGREQGEQDARMNASTPGDRRAIRDRQPVLPPVLGCYSPCFGLLCRAVKNDGCEDVICTEIVDL
jgi:hypothetical protein